MSPLSDRPDGIPTSHLRPTDSGAGTLPVTVPTLVGRLDLRHLYQEHTQVRFTHRTRKTLVHQTKDHVWSRGVSLGGLDSTGPVDRDLHLTEPTWNHPPGKDLHNQAVPLSTKGRRLTTPVWLQGSQKRDLRDFPSDPRTTTRGGTHEWADIPPSGPLADSENRLSTPARQE